MMAAVDAPNGGLASALHGRPCACVVGQKLRFRPQLFWQEVLPQHVANAQLQFHADMATGKTFARIPADKEYAADGSLARSVACAVSDSEADEDDRTSRALREAASWREVTPLQHLLSSCYCSVHSLEPALFEAAQQGHAEHVALLCKAGASVSAQRPEHRKTALHIACEQGFEDAAKALIDADPSVLNTAADQSGLLPLQLARAMDLGPMARRLEEYAQQLQGTGKTPGDSSP